jgi:hypothetical protein
MNPYLSRILAQQHVQELRHGAAGGRIGREGRSRRNARGRNPIGRPSVARSFLVARLGGSARHLD